METNTPIDHKRVQGILVAIVGFAIAQFTDWTIPIENLNFAVGEAMYISGILYSYIGGWVAKGPINWSFGSNKIKLDPNVVTLIDKSALTENELIVFEKILEKAK